MQIDPSLNFLPKQGETSQHLRSLDWAASTIGAPHAWPETLRTSLSLCLSSRLPILIWWGKDLSVLYNDAYIPFLGANKHPAVMGRPGKECWGENWNSVGPVLQGVMQTGEAALTCDAEYFFDRALPREEVYVTFTYGPILSADGLTTEGVFCPCTETTEKIIGDRRLAILRRLSAPAVPAPDAAAAAQRVCDVLADGQRDVPFCLIYQCGDGQATLLAHTGVPAAAQAPSQWPLAATEPQTVELATLGLTLPGGPWPDDAVWARILPVRWTSDGAISGVMVLGVSARRPLDAGYRDFLDLVAHHSAGAIASAVVRDHASRRSEALAEPAPLPAPSPTAAGERARVLCVDGNADLRDYIHGLLASRYEVQDAADGDAALRLAWRDPPDLVIGDVMMPGPSGQSLLQALRHNERTRTVPVILVSARGGAEAGVPGMDADADDYLIKPFAPSELRARVASHLRLSRLRKDVENTLRDADARKDEFLAILGHELRNPLAPLQNGLHLLRMAGPYDARTTRIHAMLERQIKHIARLVDDLLDIARITNGKILLQRAQVDLVDMLRHVVDASRESVAAAGQTLEVHLPAQPVIMDADEVRLTQLVSNLLSNACKYTDRGGHIALCAVLEPDGCFVVSVRDNGRGIPAHMLTQVFEPFVQINTEGGASGLGIGLAMAHRLAELHGGSVQARSAGIGAGSEFVLRLPVR